VLAQVVGLGREAGDVLVARGDALQEVGRQQRALAVDGREGIAAGGHRVSEFSDPLRQALG
jgi:hypothetical protein